MFRPLDEVARLGLLWERGYGPAQDRHCPVYAFRPARFHNACRTKKISTTLPAPPTHYSLNHLRPITLKVPLELVLAAKVHVELRARNELEQVRVEAHLVARNGVEEGRDALVEEGEQHREVDDERAAQGLDVVLLQDREDLQFPAGSVSGGLWKEEWGCTLRAMEMEGFVRSVVLL